MAASWAGVAQAYDDPYSPGGSTLLDLGRYRTPFEYGGIDHTAHVGRYGVGFFQPAGPDADFSLQGGYITLDVDGEPASQPLDFTGRYLGLGFRYESTEGDYLNFAAETSYTWHDVDASGINTQANITWYGSWAAAGPVLRWQRWRLSFGGYWQRFDGTEDDGGTLGTQLDFSAGRSAGAYLGIAYYVDQTGSVGIYATSGARQGVKLVFKREF
ncbi:MAG TPA: hypothetical protein VKT74_00930 [Gammaproteobacteria bacterium]|nr:hypothetical protein [Gammaproteobacteria bacterium]